MLLALIMCFIILVCIPIIDNIGFASNLTPLVKDYFFITAFATFGGYLHCVTKEYLQAFEIVMFPNIVTIICVFLNIFMSTEKALCMSVLNSYVKKKGLHHTV